MKRRFLGIFLSGMMLSTLIFWNVFAAGELNIDSWNATTSLFTATLSGTAAEPVTVTLGGETATAAVTTTGGKTTVTAQPADRLSLDTDYTAEIMAGGVKIAEKEFRLQTLWADDFDSYQSNAAIGEVYKGSNGNAAADAVDGAMRIRSQAEVGVITHKDFSTTQKSWRDYTLEYDYIPGTELANNQAATNAFAFIECGAENPDLKFDALGKSSTAYIYLDNGGSAPTGRMIAYVKKADGNMSENIWDKVKGVNERSNIQISTKGNKVTFYGEAKNGSGRLAYEKPIPEGIPRGGGFAFVPRGKNFCIDNLKVYKAVDRAEYLKSFQVGEWNATTKLVAMTLGAALEGTLTAKIDGETARLTNSGATLTLTPAKDLSLDETHYVKVYADGSETVRFAFRLETLWADDFNGYANDAAIREVYKGSNGNAIADLAGGTMRIRSMTDVGTVTHKDFSTTQKSWQDYTLEYDYIPGTALANNQAATQAFAFIECGAESPDVMFGDLGKSSTAYMYLDNGGSAPTGRMIPYVKKADGNMEENIWDKVKGVTEQSNIQISTKGNKVTFYGEAKNGSDRLAYEKTIPDGIARGGGFAFVPRGKNFCIDNLKVYKAEKVDIAGCAENVTFSESGGKLTASGTAEALNQTESAKPLTLVAVLYNSANRMTGVKVLNDVGSVGAGESVSCAFTVSSDSTDANRLQIYAFDNLTSLRPYGKQITVNKK